MGKELVDKLEEKFIDYFVKVIEDYKDTALLINASCIAQERYIINEQIGALSIISGIPEEYRFSVDIDVPIGRHQLIDFYQTRIPKRIAENYLVTTISTIDALLEDIYEILLSLHSHLSDQEIKKKMENPWQSLPTYFRQEIQLKKPEGSRFEPIVYLDNYDIVRQLRHALVHNKGVLSDRHYNKIKKIEEKIPEENSVLNSYLIDENRTIRLDTLSICMIRFWVLSFISYMQGSFTRTFG
jgi:hypothetical protein